MKQSYFLLVWRVKYYAGKYRVSHDISPDDGQLDVLSLKRPGFWPFIAFCRHLGQGTLHLCSDIDFFKVTKLQLDSKNQQHIHADAEYLEENTAVIKLSENKLFILK